MVRQAERGDTSAGSPASLGRWREVARGVVVRQEDEGASALQGAIHGTASRQETRVAQRMQARARRRGLWTSERPGGPTRLIEFQARARRRGQCHDRGLRVPRCTVGVVQVGVMEEVEMEVVEARVRFRGKERRGEGEVPAPRSG